MARYIKGEIEEVGAEKRIEEWIRSLIAEKRPVELVSFYEELPVRAKVKPLSLEDKFIQWESHPKLKLAVENFGRVYTYFNDPVYNQKRILTSDVTYYSDSLIETTMFKPFEEPRFSREFPRVTVSSKLPVKVAVIDGAEKQEYQVRDVSENGVGFLAPKGTFSPGNKIKLEVFLPYGSFSSEAEVRSIEPVEDKEKVGVRFVDLQQRFRDLLHKYVMTRQREILNTIKMLAD